MERLLQLLDERLILGVRVHATHYLDAGNRITAWSRARGSRREAPFHTIMESYDCAQYPDVINRADLVTPGGRSRG